VRALGITYQPPKGETMTQYLETIYLAVKTLICFAGYVASIFIGEPSETLGLVTALSAGSCALFALIQTDWS
jgi:hypothetical protein